MAIATVYRSVRVVLQNSTNSDFAVQGVATLRGSWNATYTPKQSDVVVEQSAVTWMSESTQIGTGTSAFVRLSSLSGYVQITWSLPWVGKFELETVGPPGLSVFPKVDDRQPDEVVVTVMLTPSDGREDRAATKA